MHTRCQEINYIPCSMGAPHYPNGAAHFKFVPQNDNIICFYKLAFKGKTVRGNTSNE